MGPHQISQESLLENSPRSHKSASLWKNKSRYGVTVNVTWKSTSKGRGQGCPGGHARASVCKRRSVLPEAFARKSQPSIPGFATLSFGVRRESTSSSYCNFQFEYSKGGRRATVCPTLATNACPCCCMVRTKSAETVERAGGTGVPVDIWEAGVTEAFPAAPKGVDGRGIIGVRKGIIVPTTFLS